MSQPNTPRQRKVSANGQPIAMEPAAWEVADAASIQALAKGEATADQQARALRWIIEQAALTYDLEYRTETRDHAFCSGRRFVGLQIVKMLKLNLTTITGKLNPKT